MRNLLRFAAAFAVAAVLLAGCDGGSSGAAPGANSSATPSSPTPSPPPTQAQPPATPSPPSAAPLSKAQAFKFLNQATFGATEAEAQRLIALADRDDRVSRWIDEQLGVPPSMQLAYVQAASPNPAAGRLQLSAR